MAQIGYDSDVMARFPSNNAWSIEEGEVEKLRRAGETSEQSVGLFQLVLSFELQG